VDLKHGAKRVCRPSSSATLSPPPQPGAPHLARFSRDVGYRRPSPQACRGSHNSTRVPYVRTSVRGPKTIGEALRQPFVCVNEERSVVEPAVRRLPLERTAEQKRLNHRFNLARHFLSGDTVGRLKPPSRCPEDGPCRRGCQQCCIHTGCHLMMG
jgi:hypothetical protein